MSIYIGNDLEDRLEALETENTTNTINWYMKSTLDLHVDSSQTYMYIVVFIRNQ